MIENHFASYTFWMIDSLTSPLPRLINSFWISGLVYCALKPALSKCSFNTTCPLLSTLRIVKGCYLLILVLCSKYAHERNILLTLDDHDVGYP
jgi:hypothetical protein